MYQYDFYKKYLNILIISLIISSLIFLIVRIPRKNLEIKSKYMQLIKDDVKNTENNLDNLEFYSGCVNKSPYTILSDRRNDYFHLCLSPTTGKTIKMKCPNKSVFNKLKNICESTEKSNECDGKPDDTKIYIPRKSWTYSNLPYNRSYSLCQQNKVAGTFNCPTDRPLFNGQDCVPNNICYKKPQFWKFPHDTLKTSYHECIDHQIVEKKCPTNYYFSHNGCILKNACFGQPNGERFADSNDPKSYIECVNENPLKRKCVGEYEYFHNAKKMCLERNPCTFKPNQFINVENDYLKRTSVGIKCDKNEIESRIYCSGLREVFDETTGKCRHVNIMTDLKDGRVYGMNLREYYDKQHPNNLQTVEEGKFVDQATGLIKSVCTGKQDGELFNVNDVTKYLECVGGNAVLKHCNKDEMFFFKCIYRPCMFPNRTNTGGLVPEQSSSNSRYFCKDSTDLTFIYKCPEGSVPRIESSTFCGLDTSKSTSQIRQSIPKYLNRFEYQDSNGKIHNCRNDSRTISFGKYKVTPVASQYQMKCVEDPCNKINYSSWPLIPISNREGVECFENKVVRLVPCGKNEIINYEKVLKGLYGLPDCTSNENQSNIDNESYINLSTMDIVLFDRENNHAIKDDVFTEINGLRIHKNEELEDKAEIIQQSLPPIVSRNDIPNYKAIPRPVDCDSNELHKGFPGYPKFYQRCKDGKRLAVRGKSQIYLPAGITDAKIFPVFSNCKLFAVGPSSTRYRLFKCPAKAPYFNYLQNKCVPNIVEGQFLCEEFYFKNYELFSSPYRNKLPAPKDVD